MNYTHEEILDALEVIQEICLTHHRECEKSCPFAHGTYCEIARKLPDEWDIGGKENVWRAFK